MSDAERRKFITCKAEARLFSLDAMSNMPWDYADEVWAIEHTFRVVLMHSSDEVRCEVAQRVIDLILNGTEKRIAKYVRSFFRSPDIHYVEEAKRPVLIDYLLSQARNNMDSDLLVSISGIQDHLDERDAVDYVDSLIKAMLSVDRSSVNIYKNHLESELGWKLDDCISKRVKKWRVGQKDEEKARMLDGIISFRELLYG